MIIPDEIKQLSTQDKFQLMEALWDDIFKNEDELEVPDWHKILLDDREKLVGNGKTKFIDLETVKKEIGEAIR